MGRPLSALERRVVAALARTGGSNKIIARDTGLTLSSVHGALQQARKKLGAHSRTEVVLVYARSQGLQISEDYVLGAPI